MNPWVTGAQPAYNEEEAITVVSAESRSVLDGLDCAVRALIQWATGAARCTTGQEA